MATQIINNTENFLSNLFVNFLDKFIIALIILLIGFIIGRVLGRLVQKVLNELDLNSILEKGFGTKLLIEEIIGYSITYIIYFIAIILALERIGLATEILQILSGIIIILVILSIFLGLKDFIPNAMGGFFINRKSMIKKGDLIKIRNIEGTVVEVNLVETKIHTKKGDIIHFPNSVFTKTEFIKLK